MYRKAYELFASIDRMTALFLRGNGRFVRWLPRRIRIVRHHSAGYLFGVKTQVFLIDRPDRRRRSLPLTRDSSPDKLPARILQSSCH